jgi:phosphatidylglycerophosphate synthase
MKALYGVLIVLGSIMKLTYDLPFAFIAMICIVFFLFIKENHSTWSKLKYFGVANIITTSRLLMVLYLSSGVNLVNHPFLYIPITLIPLLDVVDGWIARQRMEETYFGMLYDMEVDALFVLSASIIIFEKYPSLWIVLIPAYLRYIYKAGITIFDKENAFQESKQKYASVIAGNYFIALIVFYLFENKLANIYITISSLLILFSFGKSFVDFLRWKHAQ